MGRLKISATIRYGHVGGLEYLRSTGRFRSEVAETPFELITPADQTSGVVTCEIGHPFTGEALARDRVLGPDIVLGPFGGNSLRDRKRSGPRSHAVVGWPSSAGGDDPYRGPVEHYSQFVQCLRSGFEGADELRFAPDKAYGAGFSDTGRVVHRIVGSPAVVGLLDFALIGTVSERPYRPRDSAADGPNAIWFYSESEIIAMVEEGLRSSALTKLDPKSRAWVAAAGPHIVDNELTPGSLPFCNDGYGPRGTTPIDWSPMARAAWVAGHLWGLGKEPPPTQILEIRDGKIVRDRLGHARGGLRHPSLELAEAKLSARRPSEDDPRCQVSLGSYSELRELGVDNFPGVDEYVQKYTAQIEALRANRYLLRIDARKWTSTAIASARLQGLTVSQAYDRWIASCLPGGGQ